MKIDLYTKTVLTVIAIALSAVAFQNIIPNADAQLSSQVQKVELCTEEGNCTMLYTNESSGEGNYVVGVSDLHMFNLAKNGFNAINRQLTAISRQMKANTNSNFRTCRAIGGKGC